MLDITTKCLVIHKEAGFNTDNAGAISDYGVYTIVEEKKLVIRFWGS